MKSVAVIGAGGAGLAMARYLCANQKLFKCVVYEQGSQVGGTWIYEDEKWPDQRLKGREIIKEMTANDKIHSSMYKSLRTNLPKQVMEYPDFPFPKESRTFLTHKEVLDYLKDYCNSFGLADVIQFNTRVKKVIPLLRSNDTNSDHNHGLNVRWRVTTFNQNSEEMSNDFDSVVVCNGHFAKPNVPDIPNIEKFTGSILHSHFYRVPDSYKDKEVIVLGARASGRDIAIDVAKVAKHVLLSHKGEAGSCPFPENITETKSIKFIDNDGQVVFEDGSKSSADSIIFCTGYLYDFPFLDECCSIKVQNGRVFPLYKQIFNIHYPSMAFIGLSHLVCPFKLFSMQARWIVNVLSGEATLPSFEKMLEDYNEDCEIKLNAGVAERHFHRLVGGLQWEYYNTIAKLGNVEPMEKVIEKLYHVVAHERTVNLLNYRETEYEVLNDEDFEVVHSR